MADHEWDLRSSARSDRSHPSVGVVPDDRPWSIIPLDHDETTVSPTAGSASDGPKEMTRDRLSPSPAGVGKVAGRVACSRRAECSERRAVSLDLPHSLWNRADFKKMSDDTETRDGEAILIASMILEERRQQRVVALFPAGEAGA